MVERTIRSVLAQTGDFDLEIIVVDDCSTDNSCDIIAAIADERIILKKQSSNKGPAAARNVGIKLATGKYLAFLDADDYWKPGFMAKTVSFLERHDEAIAVSAGQIHKIPGKPDSIAPKICANATPEIKEKVLDDFWSFWAEHNHICTGSALIRTDIARQTGGQREDLRILEDWEYWGLLSTYGKWGFIQDILFVSDGGAVTKEQGWLKKHKMRWQNTPTVCEWRKRLLAKSPSLNEDKGFQVFCGIIAHMTSYNMILAGFYKKSYKNILPFMAFLPANQIAELLKKGASKGYCSWLIICVMLHNIQFIRHLKRMK